MSSGLSFLVLGIGNCLMTDDGVGVHAVRRLQLAPPPDTEVVDAGTDFFATLPFLERARRVLVIDAMDAGGPPGTLYQCPAEDLADPHAGASLHELGLMSVMKFLPAERRPESVVVLGVQPAHLGFGTELSPDVAAALPALLEEARRAVEDFRRLATRGSGSSRNGGVSRSHR